jgi:hypothetical protein
MEAQQWTYVLAQVMGVLTLIPGFISFQLHTQKKILIAQTIMSLLFCVHYLLLGAASGLVMNILQTIRNLTYYQKDRKWLPGRSCPIFFAVLMAVLGAFSWQGWYSLLIIAAPVINSICMALPNPQIIRKSILVTSPMVLLYDVFVGSIGGIVYESVAIISAIIGIFTYRRMKKA